MLSYVSYRIVTRKINLLQSVVHLNIIKHALIHLTINTDKKHSKDNISQIQNDISISLQSYWHLCKYSILYTEKNNQYNQIN